MCIGQLTFLPQQQWAKAKGCPLSVVQPTHTQQGNCASEALCNDGRVFGETVLQWPLGIFGDRLE